MGIGKCIQRGSNKTNFSKRNERYALQRRIRSYYDNARHGYYLNRNTVFPFNEGFPRCACYGSAQQIDQVKDKENKNEFTEIITVVVYVVSSVDKVFDRFEDTSD